MTMCTVALVMEKFTKSAWYFAHQGSYTYLKFKFQEFSRRKQVIFAGVFHELYMQNFAPLLHTFLNCMTINKNAQKHVT